MVYYTAMLTSLTRNATFLALTTACISGISVFVNKYAITGLADPILFSALKNSIVALFFVGILFAMGTHREIRTLTKKQWGRLVSIGFIGGALPFGLFFTGLSMIPAVHGAILHKTLFIWVALLATIFLRERFSPMQWLGVTALFVANTFIGGFNGLTWGMGELLVLGATLLWAVESIVAKKILNELSSVVVASGRMVFGSLFLLVFLGITGNIGAMGDMTLAGVGWTALTAILLCGYVLTWYTALKYAPASYVTALLVPATLITNVLSAVFVTGTLTEAQVISGFLMFLGTTFVVLFAYNHTKAPHSNKYA